ncbi:hypothetical protein ONE63_009814 [Megalurothrips usitatus]|uniref:DNA primase large subunit C-terminal domain-containing protein n=1 Tax=Megalurothrips usitatus TaxID=439358 RepID=A0AAV7XJD5_9NEOP|nr:hypothetical protein ONE63_009814 [Megalurothrips usitatus]
MTFYFKPPRGDILFHRLQECMEERVRYLHFVENSHDISECCEPFKFKYLTDGSALDRTGHFMLRLIALRLPLLKEFLLRSETLLFEKRLRCLNHSQVERELKTALRHAKEILSFSNPILKFRKFLHIFIKFCSEIISSRGIQHTFLKDHSDDCEKHLLQVPFTFCLSLISARQVEMRAGNAIVPCGKWRQLLSCVFLQHMKYGMEQFAASDSFQCLWADERLRHLLEIVRAHFKSFHPPAASNVSPMLSNYVDERSSYFPPCMKNLHITLRHRHRLSHYSRFYYSLFLKDVGMPMMEAIEFWSKEYAQTNSNCTSCSHSWQKDNKRYIYSIRHLYGLEGSRREYSSPGCHQFQKMGLAPSSEGGCPFLDFDKEKLLKCLHDGVKADDSFIDSLIYVKSKHGANEACKLYCTTLCNFIKESKKVECGEQLAEASESKLANKISSPSQFYSNLNYFIEM